MLIFEWNCYILLLFAIMQKRILHGYFDALYIFSFAIMNRKLKNRFATLQSADKSIELYEMKHFDWLASGAEFHITDLAENIKKIGKQLLIIVGIVFSSVLTARTTFFWATFPSTDLKFGK